MPKQKKYFECQSCGAQFAKWQGQCTDCNKWNTLEEVTFLNDGASSFLSNGSVGSSSATSTKVSDIKFNSKQRLSSGINELDNVLGGGFVKGQVTLLAGEPGIGKSTLLLQLANSCNLPVYYICGEESSYQVKERYTRLGLTKKDINLVENTAIETIDTSVINKTPCLIIIDSVHSLFSARYKSSAGTLSQIKECSQYFTKIAKTLEIPLILVGQINKQGDIAGPKTLEHLVDTVLFLEGDNDHTFRVLKSQKNRFGSVNEIGLFTMDSKGLLPVTNPSEYLLSGRVKDAPGSSVCIINEGNRCYAVEVQALLNKTVFGYPKRTANGFSLNRLNMLAAVVANRLNLKLSDYDIYLNIASGLKVSEPAIDLAVCAALVSAYKNKPLPSLSCYYGEVGLNGEVRPVKMQDKRQKEAEKVGFKKIYNPGNIRLIKDIIVK
jgi:DNA repair protein RadA/Sms